jgi:hypothetical protein
LSTLAHPQVTQTVGRFLAKQSKVQMGDFMPKKSSDDFFKKKHAKLANFAFAANIFAWILLIVHIFLVWGKYVEVQNAYNFQASFSGNNPDFGEMLKGNTAYAASLYLDMLGIFLRGVVFALVLNGVSLGLYILLENNLNKKGADDDESMPVFYKPQDVLWLEKWISRASFAVIGLTAVISIFDFSRAKQITSVYFTNQPGADLSANITAGVLIALNIIFVSALYYSLLKSLSSALKILMEVEHNSRRAKR